MFQCSGALILSRGETLHWWTLIWIKWHVAWTLCLGASCSKAPEGEECLSSLVFSLSLQLRIIRQLWWLTGTSSEFLCLVSGYEFVTASLTSSHCRRQNSSGFGMTAPFMTEKQTLFPMACVCGAALRTSCPPWSNTSLPGDEAQVILWYKWSRGTCLLTRWRQGLSVDGGCLLPQLALPPHLALITAGCSE